MKKLSVIFFALILAFSGRAAQFDICSARVADDVNSQFNKAISQFFPDEASLTQDNVNAYSVKLKQVMAADMQRLCGADLFRMADEASGSINLQRNNKIIRFQFADIASLFDFMRIRTGIMVYNSRTSEIGDVVQLSSIPKNPYFSDECSDHTIRENLSDNAAVNVAGQKVFSSYGGSKNEFFLDFAEGNNRRAFPGLVLMDKTGSTAERIVMFDNVVAGRVAAKNFADALKNSECSGQGLAVYQVALDVQKMQGGGGAKDIVSKGLTYGIGGMVGGIAAIGAGTGAVMAGTGATMAAGGTFITAAAGAGAAAGMGLGVGTSIATGAATVAGTAATAAGTTGMIVGSGAGLSAATGAGAIAGAGASLSWIPVAGWIVAGVALTTAAVIALIPAKIADIQQVMIISDPYPI